MLHKAGCKQVPKLNGIINYLQKHFRIKEVTHDFPEGTRDAIIFITNSLLKEPACAVTKGETSLQRNFADYRTFMALSLDKQKVTITYQHGDLAWLLDIKAAYNAVMDLNVSPWGNGLDPHMLSEMGFLMSAKKVNICLACKCKSTRDIQHAPRGHENPLFSSTCGFQY